MPARTVISAMLAWLLGSASALAQAPEVIYCRQPVFRIPFQIDPGELSRLREVQLYAADEQGRTWKLVKTVGPAERSFPFKADRDGLFLFLVRTLDTDGKGYPQSIDGAPPGLRVMVDTQLPVAVLRPLQAKPDQYGIEWEVRDDNLDLQSLTIEYRPRGSSEWTLLGVEPQAVGQKFWTPAVRGPVDLRLRVRDKAENQGSAYLVLPTNANEVDAGTRRDRQGYEANPNQDANAAASRTAAKIVNSTEISLNYGVDDVGPSGLSTVELWYTTDGRRWQKFGDDPDHKPPFVFTTKGEGTYGLSLIVKSGVGIGDRPPQTGDAPQMWIEVDTTKPTVQVTKAEAGRGGDNGSVLIQWTATDRNIALQPISLFYAQQPDGPWNPIVNSLDNTGRYVWRTPDGTPPKIYIRVEAIDKAGNIGRADTPSHVVIDLSHPKGRLLGVDGPSKNP